MTASPAPAPQKTEKTAEKGTRYVVLMANSDDPNDRDWTAVRRVAAISASAAVKAVADGTGEGRYIAVPSRSWKPVKVTVSTETKVTLG